MRHANYIKMEKKYWKIKFFGSKNRKRQVKLVKTIIAAPKASDVEGILRNKYGYQVINGLKIHEYVE